MLTLVIALMAASVGAILGFFACAIMVITKHADEQQKVFDSDNDPS